MPRVPFIVGLILSLALAGIYFFGGPVWRPIYARLKGADTVNTVLNRLEPTMSKRFANIGSLTDGEPFVLLVFKEECELLLLKKRMDHYEWVKTYSFTGFSGRLGPKLQRGDSQIPEGIYGLEYLNPNSSYHLSMKVSYPNTFDQKMASIDQRTDLGGDIFIHGSNATIGCIPIGDDKIEELFYLVAKNGYKSTKVIIVPCDFRNGKPKPSIESVDWEDELYELIQQELSEIVIQ